MRFRGLDLNHLVTLETLLTERSLTRTAERHLLTQPAISNALTRLREFFGDELLLRHGREMERTPFAEQLLPQLRAALAQLQSVAIAKPAFDPLTTTRTLRLLTSDYVAQVFLPEVIRHFFDVAPKVVVAHIPMSADALSDFERGEVDAIISPLGPAFEKRYPHKRLYGEEWVCVARQDNAAVPDSLSAADYYQAPHAIPSYKHYIIDHSWPPPPDVIVRAPVQLPFSAIPALISQSDYVAVLPERMVRLHERQLRLRRIALLPPPPVVNLAVYWHPEHALDEFLMWSLERLVAVGASLEQPTEPLG